MKVIIEIPDNEIPEIHFNEIPKIHFVKGIALHFEDRKIIKCNYPFQVLPEKHGRLVDADKFDCITFQNKSEEFILGAEHILEMIDDAPTIIEASEVEE